MPLLKQKMIFRVDLRNNPLVHYVFGDNEIRRGLGGQAREMRGEPNAIGVATLLMPGQYWQSSDHDRQAGIVAQDFVPIRKLLLQGKIVIYPLDGIGTGLARLEEFSPETFDTIQKIVRELEQIK